MDIFSAQKLIGDDVIQTMYERYQILEYMKLNQPAGRRKITQELGLPERQVRNHLEYLCKKNIITMDKRGVLLCENTQDVTPFLYDFFSRIYSSYEKELALEKKLGINKIIIVHGDCDADPTGLNNLGVAAENYFAERLGKGGLIAVSGGSTLKAFADNLRMLPRPNYTIVPVRGAIGASHSCQANTIALYTSMKLKCNAYQLNIPDVMEKSVMESLANHPDIVAVTSSYARIDILLFGVGRPDILAEHRHLSEEEKEKIFSQNCVAEAVGYYLNPAGEILQKSSGIGLGVTDFKRIPTKIAIAGGAKKAEAIKALCSFARDITLITDEGCADALLK